MSGVFNDTKRQVVPRWLDYRTSCALGLLAGAQPKKSPLVVFSNDPAKLTDWASTPNLMTGADLVAESYILGTNSNTQAIAAARHILKQAPPSAIIIRELANAFLQQATSSRPQQLRTDYANFGRGEVTILKRVVRANPANPVAWSDLLIFP